MLVRPLCSRVRESSMQSIRNVATAALLLLAHAALAQSAWPSAPVKLIVPFGPASTPDIVARLVAERLTPRIGQSVIVENRIGASGNIGTDAVAKAAPD